MSAVVEKGFFGTFQFEDNGLLIENPAATFKYTIQAAAIAADRILNLPLLTADDTLVTLGLAGQIFTQTIDTQIVRPSASNTYTSGTNLRRWSYVFATGGLQIATNNYFGQLVNGSLTGIYFNAASAANGIELHVAGSIVHRFSMGSNDDGAFYHLPRTANPTNATEAGVMYMFDNGASDLWVKLRSNSIWVDSEQKETISVTPGATVTLTHHAFTNVYSKWTAGENETVNASGTQVAGQRMSLIILCDGTIRTITFGTGFKPTATLVLTANKTDTIQFVSDGTNWYEVSRSQNM